MKRVRNAKRVFITARIFVPIEYGGYTMEDNGFWENMTKDGFNTSIEFNRAWIRLQMLENCLIIDIGRDSLKVTAGISISQYYKIELEETKFYFNKILYTVFP